MKNWPVVFCYTRAMAIADGVLIAAGDGELGAISAEHYPKIHLAMTADVFALINGGREAGVGASLTGIWHDVLWMSQTCRSKLLGNGHLFKVGINSGHGNRCHELKILFHPGDIGEPCATVMLRDED